MKRDLILAVLVLVLAATDSYAGPVRRLVQHRREVRNGGQSCVQTMTLGLGQPVRSGACVNSVCW